MPDNLVSRRESPFHRIAASAIIRKHDKHSRGHDSHIPARWASHLGNGVARHRGQPLDKPRLRTHPPVRSAAGPEAARPVTQHYDHRSPQPRQSRATHQNPVTRLKRWLHAGPYDAYHQVFPAQEDQE
jgi:hypothetical protein